MKKLLFLFLFIPVLSFAGITDSIGTKISNAVTSVDTSSTTKMVYNDVKTAIKSIASGLKTTAEHLMEVVAKKYFIQGIIDLVSSVLLLIVAFIIYRVGFKKLTKTFDTEDELAPVYGVGIIATLVFIVICCMHAYSQFQEGLMYVLNPEYYVIEDIFNFIKDNYKR